MKLYLNGKKITQKEVKEMVGEERFKKMLKDSKELFKEDPLIEISYFVGNGTLVFEF